jgi:MFS family permease
MSNKTKLGIPTLFFILVYFNQGISSLVSQCIYYITREQWMLSATKIGLIGFLTSLAWYTKPILGYISDRFANNSKEILLISYSILISLYAYLIIFGLNLWSLIICSLAINFCICMNDVINDGCMCRLEKKYDLKGKLQSVQWTSLGIAGLFVSLFGAYLADKFSIDVGYRIAYSIMAIVPILTLFYLKFMFKNETVTVKKPKFLAIVKSLNNKRFIWAVLFIACFQLCPSFGTALMIKMRETMGVGKMFIGILGATGTVLGIIGYILYYLKFHKYDLIKLLYFTVVFSAITNLFYLYIPNQWYLLAYNVAFGTIGGITFLAILAFYASITPNKGEAMVYAIITSVSNLCVHLSGVFGGIIYDFAGYNACVIVSTLATLACLLLIPKLKEQHESN